MGRAGGPGPQGPPGIPVSSLFPFFIQSFFLHFLEQHGMRFFNRDNAVTTASSDLKEFAAIPVYNRVHRSEFSLEPWHRIIFLKFLFFRCPWTAWRSRSPGRCRLLSQRLFARPTLSVLPGAHLSSWSDAVVDWLLSPVH